MFSTQDKIFRYIEIFFLFFLKTSFDNPCKLSPVETICMKCQALFSGEDKKTISYHLLNYSLKMGNVKLRSTLNLKINNNELIYLILVMFV